MSYLHDRANEDLAEVFDTKHFGFEAFNDYGPGDLRDAWILGYYAGRGSRREHAQQNLERGLDSPGST